MRLKKNIQEYIRKNFTEIKETRVFLFGSRVYDDRKGGDIDLLVLTNNRLTNDVIRKFKINFYKQFGWQKIDIINFTFEEKNNFKELVLNEAIEL